MWARRDNGQASKASCMKLSDRARALKKWKLVADGVLRKSFRGPPSYEYATAIAFVEEVAANVLDADTSKESRRATEMLKAVGLSGRLNTTELAMDSVLNSPDFIFSALDEKGVEQELTSSERTGLIMRLLCELVPSLSDVDIEDLRKRVERILSTR